MRLLFRKKAKPAWLEQTREFCRVQNIVIAAWGSRALVVEAKYSERRAEIDNYLSQFGLRTVESEDDTYAGLLTLSPTPEALQSELQSNIAWFDISRRPWSEQIEPLIWALGVFLLVPGLDSHSEHQWVYLPFGMGALVLFFLGRHTHLGMAIGTSPRCTACASTFSLDLYSLESHSRHRIERSGEYAGTSHRRTRHSQKRNPWHFPRFLRARSTRSAAPRARPAPLIVICGRVCRLTKPFF